MRQCKTIVLYIILSVLVFDNVVLVAGDFEVTKIKISEKMNMGKLSERFNFNITFAFKAKNEVIGMKVVYPKEIISEHLKGCIEKSMSTDLVLSEKDGGNTYISDFEKRKCVIEFTPILESNNIASEKEQVKLIKISIPSLYFGYVDFFVNIQNFSRKLIPPKDFRTTTIVFPDNTNLLLIEGDNIEENDWSGNVDETYYKDIDK
jgi:hypothetical protein